MRAVLAFLMLTACAAALAVGVGCSTYAEMRLTMPPLGTDALSAWVAILDSRMTGACTALP